ncbi:DNA circulation family protein [Hyphomicrobium denitrificans ATCC 51888]|uniref:DNA circulation family protein n=1 Tax=Hyphomicrobium denitrificans (strain ATCC 51888 / DSM 1869 / NCIMB 11706 / TK 0415) TaxID=582899 RepID=D8JWD0_HYPDA|nr:DNA circularization N-terminal domain-containing protein [Hyphomicrobium denitrificans]ADJ23043.1 DNA circulation family protein [Hyphomicrobium denitrificans ATCC 51888]
MAVFRDWLRTLRRASYRGASFFVETDKIKTGRRLVVHEFPLADDPYVEDLGRKANKIDVTAYVAGDNADGAEDALRRACDAGGAATLSLPIISMQAHCEDCSRDFKKDQLGYIAFSLSFVRDGSGAAPFPVAYLGRIIETSVGGIVAALARLFVGSFATLDFADYVHDDAADEIRSIAGQLDSAVRGTTVDVDKAPALLQQIGDFYSDADDLAAVGERADQYDDTTFIAQQSPSAAADIVTRMGDIFTAAAGAIAPDLLEAAVLPLALYVPADNASTTTESGRQSLANVQALRSCLRILALTTLATAIANRTYVDRREAIQARADAAEAFAAELDRISGLADYDVFVAVQTLSGKVADYLSRLITDLAPVVAIEAPRRMPALWWSQRLYGTADRADELVARNGVKHAAFMPHEFEALAD